MEARDSVFSEYHIFRFSLRVLLMWLLLMVPPLMYPPTSLFVLSDGAIYAFVLAGGYFLFLMLSLDRSLPDEGQTLPLGRWRFWLVGIVIAAAIVGVMYSGLYGAAIYNHSARVDLDPKIIILGMILLFTLIPALMWLLMSVLLVRKDKAMEGVARLQASGLTLGATLTVFIVVLGLVPLALFLTFFPEFQRWEAESFSGVGDHVAVLAATWKSKAMVLALIIAILLCLPRWILGRLLPGTMNNLYGTRYPIRTGSQVYASAAIYFLIALALFYYLYRWTLLFQP